MIAQKFLRSFHITLLLLASLVATPSAFSEPYTIGIPLPLTGANAVSGQDIRRGFELGKEILGIHEARVIFEDDACDGSKSVTVAKKLLEVDTVDVISGIYCNTALMSVGKLLDRSKIPVLTVGATTGDQTGIGQRIFRIFPADQLALEPLIPEMERAGKRSCMVTESEVYSELIERSVARELPKQGGQITAESVPAGTRDFRSALLRLTKRGCDSVLINAAGDDGFIAAYKQLRVIAPDLPVFALYFPGSSVVKDALGEGLRGVAYADLQSHEALATPLGNELIKRYKARYGSFLTAQPVSLLAFEALRVIDQAHKEKVPLDSFLRRGPIRGGAINDYSFDSDGAVQGIHFRVFKP